jgi:flagellar biosynthesis activator protein FlaF
MTFPAKGYQRTPEPGNPARSEAWALLEAARQLNKTKEGPIDEFRAALRANWRLWTLFQANLVDADCKLPDQLRGNLLGLANFIDKTTVEMLVERDPKKIDTLVNINRQISEGLLEGMRAKRAEESSQAPLGNAPQSIRQSA